MKIVAFILDHHVVHAILRHLHKNGRDPSRLPEHDALLPARAPP